MRPTKEQTDALIEQVVMLEFRAALRKARRSTDFVEAFYAATRSADGVHHAIDVSLLEESELWLLAGGAPFEAWWQGLDVLQQMALARGEYPPWHASS